MRSQGESSNMSSASSDSATDVSLASSRIEFTLLVSDSLYRGRPSVSYPRRIGQPDRVPTPMSVILGAIVQPDRVEPRSENSPSVIQTTWRCGVLP